ncbi:MAG TPA: alpha/beta hydrolase [Thermoanaerobaculia bacterium]|nr:alpha/beta hydrolase [Thermoanaerobaculia bacterium]
MSSSRVPSDEVWDGSGAGLHASPPDGLSMETHLDETVELLRRLSSASRRKVTVMGISIGGTLGLLIISRWPRSPVPVDLMFGDADLLSPPVVIDRARALLGPRDSLRVVPGAGHMVHFDAPAAVRSVVLGEGPSSKSLES